MNTSQGQRVSSGANNLDLGEKGLFIAIVEKVGNEANNFDLGEEGFIYSHSLRSARWKQRFHLLQFLETTFGHPKITGRQFQLSSNFRNFRKIFRIVFRLCYSNFEITEKCKFQHELSRKKKHFENSKNISEK